MAKERKKQKTEGKSKPVSGVRAFWSGTISFGLVSVPVHLFPANRRGGVSFRLLDEDGVPLQRQYYCPQHGTVVHPEHILRGYPVEGDEYVVVRDDEMEAIEPKKTREIDLRRFVDLSAISPMFFHRAYFLTPRGDSNKAYRLLAQVMQENSRAGIATFVMRDHEYLVAILAENGILRAETLRFQDQLRSPETIGLPPAAKASRGQVQRLQRLIQQHTTEQLESGWLKDDYAERVRTFVAKKHKQRKQVVQVDAQTDPEPASEVDLLATIRRSLQSTDKVRSNSRRSRTSDQDLNNKSRDELYERAQQLDISGRSKMNKQQLKRAISRTG